MHLHICSAKSIKEIRLERKTLFALASGNSDVHRISLKERAQPCDELTSRVLIGMALIQRAIESFFTLGIELAEGILPQRYIPKSVCLNASGC